MSDKITLLQREVSERGLDLPTVSENFTKTDLMTQAAEKMHMTQGQLTNFLWDKYNPGQIWMVILAIGLFATLGLFIYDKYLLKSKK